MLIEHGVVVTSAGGIPTMYQYDDTLTGVEAVIDFTNDTDGIACISSLENAKAMLAGEAGTTVVKDCPETIFVK